MDWYEAMTTQLVQDFGVEMTAVQFSELVERLRYSADEEDDSKPEEREERSKRLIREDLLAHRREDRYDC